ncbi:hypothetical protein Vau01_003210 [Virgisporangium aurantiacum]|uniref:Uncharacterized protein n=1 Tax=Virgisporangium aurantiacum TaxID=175570 RepID=A0A8J3Z040_9ACTN|nr:hypothetical protein Vau01_003210 [Virgisporangium aurantiacum]
MASHVARAASPLRRTRRRARPRAAPGSRGIPGLRRQVPVRTRKRTVYLDVFDPTTRTNFELDGAHDRLTRSPDEVRAEVSAILTAVA